MKQYDHIFIVEPIGTGSDFPVDMLRYDTCYPFQESDSYEIQRTFKNTDMESWAVTLLHVGQKNWKPTVGRWESRCWRVLNHEVKAKV